MYKHRQHEEAIQMLKVVQRDTEQTRRDVAPILRLCVND